MRERFPWAVASRIPTLNQWLRCPAKSDEASRALADSERSQAFERWRAAREKSAFLAWRALTLAGRPRLTVSTGRAIQRLMCAASAAFKVRIEGRAITRQRKALIAARKRKSAELRPARKAFRAALAGINPEEVRKGEFRFDRPSRWAMQDAGELMVEHPELALDFRRAITRPGVPSGPITRYDSRTRQRAGEDGPGFSGDPLTDAKRDAAAAFEALGLVGRKSADIRALVLFALGVNDGFDAKLVLRSAGQRRKAKGVTAPIPRLAAKMSSDGRPIAAEGIEAAEIALRALSKNLKRGLTI